MTVLSPPIGRAATIGFPQTGRYSYTSLLIDFALWDVDLPKVRARIDTLKTSDDLLVLFRNVVVAPGQAARWHHHPQARSILMQQFEKLAQAWDTVLSTCPDRVQLTLEYLADALKHLADATRLH